MTKVFIDGSAGTTGLRIRERLTGRKELTLLTLPEELRKDVSARKEAMNAADIVFLCLPDAAALEAVPLVDNPSTCIIDTSTAHTRPRIGSTASRSWWERKRLRRRTASPTPAATPAATSPW